MDPNILVSHKILMCRDYKKKEIKNAQKVSKCEQQSHPKCGSCCGSQLKNKLVKHCSRT